LATSEPEAVAQAKALRFLGCGAVLLKGGHASGEAAVDILCDRVGIERFERPRVATQNAHGTGCTLSAAIAALLAQGASLRDAVGRAKHYVWQALEAGRHLGVGRGHGPVDHLYAIRRNAPPA
jgi:hydroxymethylpyrimidine/phosphomethylpyrimidine kinase